MPNPQASLARFQHRSDAGRRLAARLTAYADRPDALVLALPRGGVPVAGEVARALRLPLDVCLVRKIGAPDNPELAVGAIASGGVELLNPVVLACLHISSADLRAILTRERAELERRTLAYLGDRPLPVVRDQTILLIDDGVATGSSMRAAIAALRLHHPARIVAAAPVAASAVVRILQREADEFMTVFQPENFYAVGDWYRDFSPTSDDEVCAVLQRSHTGVA